MKHCVGILFSVAMFDAIEAIVKCTNFAAIKHKCQRRKDPEQTPYINHPVGELNSHKFINYASDEFLINHFANECV